MVQVLNFFTVLLAWLRSSQARREAEILYLRQQLIVLKRLAPTRPRLKGIDRLIFVCLYRLFPSLLHSSIIFKPETLLRWLCVPKIRFEVDASNERGKLVT
jgi:hypothetical protein